MSYARKKQLQRKYNRRTGGYVGRFLPAPSGTEYKWFDQPYTTVAMTTVMSQLGPSLTIVPRGTASNERLGQGITVRSIHFKGEIFTDRQNNFGGTEIAHLYIVLDKECNQTAPNALDIWTAGTAIYDHINIANSERFTIIKKIVVKSDTPTINFGATGMNSVTIPIEFYMKCQIPIKWTDANVNGAIGQQTQNSLHFFGGRYNATGTCQMQGVCRIRFTD